MARGQRICHSRNKGKMSALKTKTVKSWTWLELYWNMSKIEILMSSGKVHFFKTASKEIKTFLKEYEIEHAQSLHHNPQSNGHAKWSVRIVK